MIPTPSRSLRVSGGAGFTVQCAGTLVQIAREIVQMHPVARSDRLRRVADADAVFQDGLARFAGCDRDLVAELDRGGTDHRAAGRAQDLDLPRCGVFEQHGDVVLCVDLKGARHVT